jgi:hypothetical protein
LLVGVGVVLVGIVAVFGLGFVEQTARDPTTVAVEADVTGESLTLTHGAGEPLQISETAVVLQRPDGTDRVPLSSLRAVSSDGDDLFTAGESFRLRHGVASGELGVRVVAESSGAVVYDGAFSIVDGIAGRIVDFGDSPPGEFEDTQDSSGTVTTTDDSITLTDDRWQRIPFEYNVTENTVIEFTFESSKEGEIHGIGLETDNRQTQSRVLDVFGVQGWGIPVTTPDGDEYQYGEGPVTYEVPIGEKFADRGVDLDADIKYMLFVMDCDGNEGAPCSSPDSTFRNIRVYEAEE